MNKEEKDKVLNSDYAVTFFNCDSQMIKCPICGELLFRNNLALHGHLGKHIRKGLISREDRTFVMNAVLRNGRIKYPS